MAQYIPFTATGDGSTTSYSIAFNYIDAAHVKARINDIPTTAFSVSGSTVTFNTAPANGSTIKIFRDTDNQTIQADFQSGSALRAVDLNDNFTQVLFVTQESTDIADTATSDSTAALTASSNAVTTANAASASATSAVNTANTASTNATNAVNTANTASTNASNSVTTANSAASDAATAISTANTALSTANTASTTASSASTSASNAVSTANTASTNASNAVTTANAASATATAAQNAVAAVLVYDPIANVSSIPGSPSDGDRIEIADSTGIQSFSPLTGLPSGFTGSSQLSVRLNYTSSGSTWNWTDYSALDPDARYYLKSSGTTNATNIATNTSNIATNTSNIATNTSNISTNTTDIATNTTNIATKMPLAGGTFTGAVNFDDNVVIKGDSTNGSGKLTLNCENNSHGVNIKGPPHSAGATYTLTLPNDTGSNGQSLLTNGSGALSWGNVTADLSGVLALTGGTMTGNVDFDDNVRARFGTGDDLQIYHDGNYSYIEDTGTGGIVINTDALYIKNASNSEALAYAVENSAVSLYFDNSKKFETTSSGISVTGSGTYTTNVQALNYIANESNGAHGVFEGKLSGSQTSLIKADGSAAFAGTITAEANAVAEINTLTSATSITPDFAASCNFTVTLGHNTTIANPSNVTAGQSGSIFLVQDGTGSRTAAFGSYWDFAGGSAPSLTTSANGVDRIDYIVRSSTSIHAVATLNMS